MSGIVLSLHHPTGPHDDLAKERCLLTPFTEEELRSGKVNDRPNVPGLASQSQDSRPGLFASRTLLPAVLVSGQMTGTLPSDLPFRL